MHPFPACSEPSFPQPCPVCLSPLDGITDEERQQHISDCMDIALASDEDNPGGGIGRWADESCGGEAGGKEEDQQEIVAEQQPQQKQHEQHGVWQQHQVQLPADSCGSEVQLDDGEIDAEERVLAEIEGELCKRQRIGEGAPQPLPEPVSAPPDLGSTDQAPLKTGAPTTGSQGADEGLEAACPAPCMTVEESEFWSTWLAGLQDRARAVPPVSEWYVVCHAPVQGMGSVVADCLQMCVKVVCMCMACLCHGFHSDIASAFL